jgi:hypothetical protein
MSLHKFLHLLQVFFNVALIYCVIRLFFTVRELMKLLKRYHSSNNADNGSNN